jgi:hypothetical protein
MANGPQGPYGVLRDGSVVWNPTGAVLGAPTAASVTTYTLTNVDAARTGDANAMTAAQVADVLGTLIQDLRAKGIVR